MKKYYKNLILVLTIIALMSFAACGKSDAAGSSENAEETAAETAETATDEAKEAELSEEDFPDPSKNAGKKDSENKPVTTVEKGKLTVASCMTMPPYECYAIVEDGSTELSGIEVLLVKYIADQLKLELVLVPMKQEDAMNMLAEGKADLAIMALSPDPMFAESIDTSDIYSVGGATFVCLEKSVGNFDEPEKINNFNRKIGVRKNSNQFVFVKQSAPNAFLVQRSRGSEIINDLVNGGIDGAYIDPAEARYYSSLHPEIKTLYESDFATFDSCIGVMKDNKPLLSAVNKALNEVIEDGTMDKYIAEGYDMICVAPPQNAAQ